MWYPNKIMFAKEEESTNSITCCLAMHVLSQWETVLSYSDHTINHQEVSFTTCRGTRLKHPKPWLTGPWSDFVCSTYLEYPTSQSVLCRSHIMGLTWSVPHHKVDSVIPNSICAGIFLKPSWRVYLQHQTVISHLPVHLVATDSFVVTKTCLLTAAKGR